MAKVTKFKTLQAEYNFELMKQIAASRSTRAYTFARNYAALKVYISIGNWKNVYMICLGFLKCGNIKMVINS